MGNSSGMKQYSIEQPDMTKKGRFKVRKVKTSSTDDPSKSIQKDMTKSKGITISMSPKQQQQQLKLQQVGTMGTGRITVYDVSKLFPYSHKLGQTYVLLDSPEDTCYENSRLAALAARPDLEKMWRVLARIASNVAKETVGTDNHVPWACHPMGRPMLTSIIDHYIRMLDFQTAAMIACTFHSQKINDPELEEESQTWFKVRLSSSVTRWLDYFSIFGN